MRRFARFKGGEGIWPCFRYRLALTEPHQQGRLAWLLLPQNAWSARQSAARCFLLVGGLFVLLHKEQRLRNGILLICLLLVDVLVVNHYVGMQNLIDSEARQITGQVPGSVFQAALLLAKENLLTGQGAGSF